MTLKIIAGKFKEEPNWQKWVKFKYSYGSRLSVVFLRRLAALARDMGKPMENTYGYRPIEETQRLYEADLKANGGKPSGKVATPGTSWHEHGLAVDLDGAFWEQLSKKEWVPKSRLKQSLNAYGLMVPLNKVDSPSVVEWWHIQPIETNGIPGSQRASFLDPDDEIYYGGDSMGTWEEKAVEFVKKFQKATGLTVDGKAGTQTNAKLDQLLAENKDLKTRLNEIKVKATL